MFILSSYIYVFISRWTLPPTYLSPQNTSFPPFFLDVLALSSPPSPLPLSPISLTRSPLASLTPESRVPFPPSRVPRPVPSLPPSGATYLVASPPPNTLSHLCVCASSRTLPWTRLLGCSFWCSGTNTRCSGPAGGAAKSPANGNEQGLLPGRTIWSVV